VKNFFLTHQLAKNKKRRIKVSAI